MASVKHKIKFIDFSGRRCPIVLQNANGPCPLISICNVLLLKNELSISPQITEVSQKELLSLIKERLDDSTSFLNNKDTEYVREKRQKIDGTIALLPRLATGIDVNILFVSIDAFEDTIERFIFHLLDIPLYHGWLVDPQDIATARALESRSFNDVMSQLVLPETTEGCLIKEFLTENTSQLTVHGLLSLRERLKDCEPCILFQNNHFKTICKVYEELYILITEQGYINEADVWGKLSDVNGDAVYVTGDFKERGSHANITSMPAYVPGKQTTLPIKRKDIRWSHQPSFRAESDSKNLKMKLTTRFLGKKLRIGEQKALWKPSAEKDPRLAKALRVIWRREKLHGQGVTGWAADPTAEEGRYKEGKTFSDDGIQLDPFNLEEERKRGYFDHNGFYIKYRENSEDEKIRAYYDLQLEKALQQRDPPKRTTTDGK